MKKIIFASLLFLLVLLALCSCTTEDNTTPLSLNDDGSILTVGEEEFTRADVGTGLYQTGTVYEYYNQIETDIGSYVVWRTDPEGDVCYLYDYETGNIIVYTKEIAKEEYLNIKNGVFKKARIYDYLIEAGEIELETVVLLDALSDGVTKNVQDLQNAYIYDVEYTDSTGTLAHVHGALYDIDGEIYYLNFDLLDNTYFDSYGNFSYREGTVEVFKVTGAAKNKIDAAISDVEDYTESYVYENLDGTWEEDIYFENIITLPPEVERVLIIITIVVIGFICPLFLLGLAAIRRIKKWDSGDIGNPILGVCSIIWVILATVITVILL